MKQPPQNYWSRQDPAASRDDTPDLTIAACGLCAIVFVGITLQGPHAGWAQLANWGYLPAAEIWSGKPWALLTSVFVHQEIWHIAFNLYWLWILGGCLERSIGSWRWLVFFISAAWVSSAAQLASGDTGIGMSGVVYALFGFGWVARDWLPEFKPILNDQTVKIFLLWMVGCMIATQFGWMQIANEAHLGGLVFGAAVAAAFVRRWRLPVSVPALALLGAASFVPLFWCPLSPDWTVHQAMQAAQRGDATAAVYYYHLYLAHGEDAAWAWRRLAETYANHHDRANYENALRELRKVDAQQAAEVATEYGATGS